MFSGICSLHHSNIGLCSRSETKFGTSTSPNKKGTVGSSRYQQEAEQEAAAGLARMEQHLCKFLDADDEDKEEHALVKYTPRKHHNNLHLRRKRQEANIDEDEEEVANVKKRRQNLHVEQNLYKVEEEKIKERASLYKLLDADDEDEEEHTLVKYTPRKHHNNLRLRRKRQEANSDEDEEEVANVKKRRQNLHVQQNL